jgi:hypothetical protein
MKTFVRTPWLALCTASLLLTAPLARAQSEVSALSALSAMPIASVVVGTSAAAGAVLVAPVLLSTVGTVLVVKTVESTARGTVYVLERASDGAAVSVEVLGRGLGGSLMAVGTLVTVSVIGAGTVLSVAGEVLAFIPNTLGQALLYDERVTR